MLEPPNLVHTFGGSIQAFLKKNFYQLEVVTLLNGLTCAIDLKFGIQIEGVNSYIVWKKNLVLLEREL